MNRRKTLILVAALVVGCGDSGSGETFGDGVDSLDDVDTGSTGTDGTTTDGTGTTTDGTTTDGTTTDGTSTDSTDTTTGGDEFVHDNPFGIGLVSPGNAQQLDLAANLAGDKGGVRLTCAGVDKNMHDAPQEWKDAVQMSYDRDLVPYVRLGPPWGDRRVRNQSDDGAHNVYGGLAQAYADTVASLPKREGWPLYIEVHNEPNLCYEWACDPGDGNNGWLPYETAAAEYAHMLAAVADALHGLGDPRIRVVNAGLAPGGTVSCECGGEGFQPGITSIEYIQAMLAAEPGLVAKLDAWASHSYPAEGKGWGFFVPYDGPGGQAQTGLVYYQDELATIGKQDGTLPVIMTETGWTTELGANHDQIAGWTVNAYTHVWLADSVVQAVLPFQLMDPGWDAFAWVDGNGTPRPVYNAVRNQRCMLGIGGPC
ncbi:MAG: hypothetical protein KC431_25360 [Myxococcales bacterium]|nr:hypothetical protein [Myxococcales bacterium]